MQIKPPFLLFLGEKNHPLAAKMSRSIAQWRPELCLGELTSEGNDLTLGLDRLSIGQAAEAGAKTFILGLANSGGTISSNWIPYILEALESGLDVLSGMHQRLVDIPEIRIMAEKQGRILHDIRHHQGVIETGKGRKRTGKRILTVGTDCSVGKMFTALALEKEMKARGFDVDFRATGQCGLLIAGSGVCIDAVVADFIAGAVEMISPDNDPDHWDIIEGQGSLFNPSFAGVSAGLLHGAQPDYLILCHQVGRKTIKDLPDYAVPGLKECLEANLNIARLTNPDVALMAISLNCRDLASEEAHAIIEKVSEEFSVPCFDPMLTGVSTLVDII